MNTEEFKMIPLAHIVESKTNPRRTYDQGELNDLAHSIKEKGVLQPVLVRDRKTLKQPHFELVFGSRRFRACKLAGIDVIPARVKDLTDAEVLEIQVVENLQRADIHPMDEALGYQALMKESNEDVATIAVKVGKSASYVYQRLKLIDLIKPAQDAFMKNNMTAAHAVQMARLSPTDQKDAMSHLFPKWKGGDCNMGSRKFGHWIQEQIHRDLKKAPFDVNDPDLVKDAVICAQCPKRSGFSADLFSDIQKKDVCTDRQCWNAKIEATFKANLSQLKKGDEPFVEVSGNWAGNNKQIIYGDRWKEASKSNSCDHAIKAIVMEEGYTHQKAKRGQVLMVCITPSCKVHFYQVSPRSANNPANEAQKKQKAEKAFRSALYAAIRPKLKAPSLTVIAQVMFDRLEHDIVRELCKVRDFTPPVINDEYRGSYSDIHSVGKEIEKMKPAEVQQFINDMIYARELHVNNYSDDKAERLLTAAKDAGLTPAEIRKIKDESDPAKKKAAKKKTAKKATTKKMQASAKKKPVAKKKAAKK